MLLDWSWVCISRTFKASFFFCLLINLHWRFVCFISKFGCERGNALLLLFIFEIFFAEYWVFFWRFGGESNLEIFSFRFGRACVRAVWLLGRKWSQKGTTILFFPLGGAERSLGTPPHSTNLLSSFGWAYWRCHSDFCGNVTGLQNVIPFEHWLVSEYWHICYHLLA